MNIASLFYDTISFLFNRRFRGNFTNVNFCILLLTAKKNANHVGVFSISLHSYVG